jgi:RNA polymerase sigma-70 factor (ECF subfamily)
LCRFEKYYNLPLKFSVEKEFVQLVQRNAGIIHKVIQLYVDHPEDRRDLYQEVLLQAWKSYAGFKGESLFSTWLYRISLNTVLTYRRRQRLDFSELTTQHDATIDSSAPMAEDGELLLLAIKRLNEIDRLILTLHLDGYENEEIAQVTGLSKNNTTVRLHRAKQAVIQRLKTWTKAKI